MTGWLIDFIHFWWALFYWNIRKTWFRLTGAQRDSCPCQDSSDSGLALDSRCEAILHWRKPDRFKLVCPLLSKTKDGWRCSVDAERVRPFWGRVFLFGTTAFLSVYLLGTILVYSILLAAKYDTSYLAVAWPPRWPELRNSQEQLYSTRAQAALAAGDYQTAILSLETVCKINPRNYGAGITLADLRQLSGQPSIADHIYGRLMHDVPQQRQATARIWIRTLLANSSFEQIKPLASDMLSEDPERRAAWLHALFFAVRETQDIPALTYLLEKDRGLPDWCVELVEIEKLLMEQRIDAALPRLSRVLRRPAVAYVPYYQADRLLQLGRPIQASKLIDAYGAILPSDEAAFLRLRVFHDLHWTSLQDSLQETLLEYPLTPRLATLFCASMISRSLPENRKMFFARFVSQGPKLTSSTLTLYHAYYLAACLDPDSEAAEAVFTSIGKFTGSNAKSLQALGELLKTRYSAQQIAEYLSMVPLPLEIIYAIHERPSNSIAP